MHSALVPLLASLLRCVVAHSSHPLTAITPAETVQGARYPNSEASFFLAIPYAEPPIGNLRFAAPRPYGGNYTKGIFRATVSAPSCIQSGSEFIEPETTSEDW